MVELYHQSWLKVDARWRLLAPDSSLEYVGYVLLSSHCSKSVTWLFAVIALLTLGACPEPPPQVDAGVVPLFDASVEDTMVEIACTEDDDCHALGASSCQTARCGKNGICGWEPSPDGEPCTTGNACMIGQVCSQGVCTGGAPKPPCGNLECGVDSCGNECGKCDQGFECEQGACAAVLCQGIEWQGCCSATGMVKWCDEGELLSIACPDSRSPDRRACGWDPSKGHFDCTVAESPDPAQAFPYLCPDEECPPEPCGGRECGFACGESCGDCGPGKSCADGSCVDVPDVPDVIDGDVLDDVGDADTTSDTEGPVEDSQASDLNNPDEDGSPTVDDVLTDAAADGDNDVSDASDEDADSGDGIEDGQDTGNADAEGAPG